MHGSLCLVCLVHEDGVLMIEKWTHLFLEDEKIGGCGYREERACVMLVRVCFLFFRVVCHVVLLFGCPDLHLNPREK